jgi:HTH-type transcriptional repressor of NAD biosynthesis genes
MMNRGFILMTGLPISEGHIQLVRWAASFGVDELYVMICGTQNDPIPLHKRVLAMQSEFRDSSWTVHIEGLEHGLPDYPEQFSGTVEEFDQQWVLKINEHLAGRIEDFTGLDEGDFLFASDIYGARFAKNLGVGFAPFDPSREVVKISGTKIRRDPFNNYKYIAPFLRRDMQASVTIFGAESTGKTTMTRKLADKYTAAYTFEWARPYLESLPTPEVTDERMRMIVRGQTALQISARSQDQAPFIFQDTDLFSTLGYYRIYKGGTEQDIKNCTYQAVETASSLYIVMNGNIRFTPDPLRYGVTKRESDDKFWIDILEEFGLKYHYVQTTNQHAQEDEVQKVVEKFFLDANPVFGFERV